MHGCLRGGDDTGLDQLLYARMVNGGRRQFAVADHVQTRIAGMCPAGLAVLHHTANDGGARAFEHVVLVGKGNDGAVCRVNGGLEKFFRPAQRVARLLLKAIRHGVDRDLCGDLASRMATHAVGDDHHQHILRIRIGQSILIDLAATDEAVLEDSESHYGSPVPVGRETHARESRRARVRGPLRSGFMIARASQLFSFTGRFMGCQKILRFNVFLRRPARLSSGSSTCSTSGTSLISFISAFCNSNAVCGRAR